MNLCQNCNKNPASVHVTELVHESPTADAQAKAPQVHEQHLCEVCAQTMDLPHAAPTKKTPADIWKLLQLSANQARKKAGPACPACGMTLDEFRKKGRLGCPQDYEVFRAHLAEVLERVHGASRHEGRIPGGSAAAAAPQSGPSGRIQHLRQELENAIRAEAYESAARLRDEIKAIEDSARA